ncbi:MAG: polysaccharide deacetylase family protein [Methylophilaceae bacterium]
MIEANLDSVENEIKKSLAGRKIYFTTSWDDGALDDIKLVELAKKHDVPIMLFVCPKYRNRPTLTVEMLRQLAGYCEIGSHTMNHQPIDNCSVEVAIEEVTSGRKYLEDALSQKVPDFCLVGGRYNDENLAAISALVRSVRTTGAFSFKRPMSRHFIVPSLQIRYERNTHPAKTLYEAFKNLKLAGFSQVLKEAGIGVWQKDMIKMVSKLTNEQDVYLHLWGHSWDVAKQNAWSELEELFLLLKAIDAKPLKYSQFIDRRWRTSNMSISADGSGFVERRSLLE